MSTNFPTSLDALTNPTGTDNLDSPDHAAQHANANDAIEALEAKVGVDGSAVAGSLDYQMENHAHTGAADDGGAVAAGNVTIADAGGFYTGTDVESALQELGGTGTGGGAAAVAPYFPDIDDDPWGMPVPPPATHPRGHELFSATTPHVDTDATDPSITGTIMYWDNLNQLWTLGDANNILNIPSGGGGPAGPPGLYGTDESEDYGMWVPPSPAPNLNSAVYGRNHKGSNQALTGSGAWYQVTFGVASEENPAGFFVNAGDDYVIPEAGTYTVIGQVTWDIPVTNHTERRIAIYKNGTAIALDHLTVSSTTDPSSHVVSFTGAFAVNDSIELWAFSEDGAGAAGYRVLGGADETYLNIFKLGGPVGAQGPIGRTSAQKIPPAIYLPEPEEFGMWVPPRASDTSLSTPGAFRKSIIEQRAVWLYTDCFYHTGTGGPMDGGWIVSGTTAAAAAFADHPGVYGASTGTSTSGTAYISPGPTATWIPGGGRCEVGFVFRTPSSLSDGTDIYRMRVGFIDTVPAAASDPTNFIGFDYKHDVNSGNWRCFVTGIAAQDSGVAVATTTWTHLKFVINAAGSSVDFYVNDVYKATVSGTLPSSGMWLHCGLRKGAGTGARVMYIDMGYLHQQLTTDRIP